MTTTNLTYTLDYTGKSNPVLTLYWPTNGAQISGTNFVWRGSVDDPTVTLSAQITDASGDTNVVTGIVERNGNFWVENLPLASGINSLTLTATDAAGNVTNITNVVVQSSVILTLAPNSDITCLTTADVSGTINSTGYSVWVNGLETTVLSPCRPGLWSWTIPNVPVNGAGTAVFQAEAIPTGGGYTGGGGGTNSTLQNPGNPFSAQCAAMLEVCPDTQPVIICTEYHQVSTTVSDCPVVTSYGVYTDYTYSQDWVRGVGGGWLSTGFTDENDGTVPYDYGFGWESVDLDATGNGTESNGWSSVDNDYTENVCTSSWYDGSFLGSATYGWAAEYAGWNTQSDTPWWDPDQPDYDDGDVSDYYMKALAYVPGGKAVPVQYVVQFTCNASGAPSADWMGTTPAAGRNDQNYTSIPYPDITMAGGRLGTDGYYYKVVSSGSDPIDITPSFDGGPGMTSTSPPVIAPTIVNSYWHFTVAANTYKAVVQMVTNGCFPVTLDPSNPTEICVGQNVQFQTAFIGITPWAPPLLACPQSYGNWTFPGDYVNRMRRIGNDSSANYCTNYDIDPNLLRNYLGTSNWFVEPLQKGGVSVGGRLYFPNGQDVLFAALGQISIYTPLISSNLTNINGKPYFTVTGTSTFTLGLGWPGVHETNNMSFDAFIISKYMGHAGWTQLISGTQTPGTPAFGLKLDNQIWYGGSLVYLGEYGDSTNQGPVPLQDSPGVNCPLSLFTHASESLTFVDYLRFIPDGGNSIPVTIQIAAWTASGSASVKGGGWVVDPGGVVLGPYFVQSFLFPIWTSVYRNSMNE